MGAPMRPLVEYLLISLRVLPLLYLVIQYSGDISKHLLFPIFGEDEILFRAVLISVLIFGFFQFLSLRLLNRFNEIIWFEAQGSKYWLAIYKIYKYLFLVFGFMSLFIGSCIYLKFNIKEVDWFFYRENLFLGFIAILCITPVVQVFKKYK